MSMCVCAWYVQNFMPYKRPLFVLLILTFILFPGVCYLLKFTFVPLICLTFYSLWHSAGWHLELNCHCGPAAAGLVFAAAAAAAAALEDVEQQTQNEQKNGSFSQKIRQ